METVLDRLPRGSRVALVRLRSLGDCVLTTPALQILKEARPDLEVAVVVEERFAAVFAGNPGVDCILPPEAGAMVRWHPQLCLNLHGGTRSIVLTIASRARFRAGFAHFRAQHAYNVHIPTAQQVLGVSRTVHTAEHLASAVFHLGAPLRDIPRARLFPRATELSRRPYAVIHPIASTGDKTWPATGFLAAAEHIERTWELEPVFIAGPGEDLSAFAPYRSVVGAPLENMKSTLAGASLFVGNDSGPAHMAAALGVPLAVVFGASDPVIWAPWKAVHRLLQSEAGIGAIPPGDVIAAIDELMKVPA